MINSRYKLFCFPSTFEKKKTSLTPRKDIFTGFRMNNGKIKGLNKNEMKNLDRVDMIRNQSI